MLHAAFVRSPYAHARVLRIDAGAASALPGVRLVLTGADIADRIGAFPINPAEDVEITRITHPVLATDRVRYVGEAVAVVAAESPAQAGDAAQYLPVDYQGLPPPLEAGPAQPPLPARPPGDGGGR